MSTMFTDTEPRAGDDEWALLAKLLEKSPGPLTPADFEDLDLSGLPTSNPGGGKPWLNGGVLQVGA